MKDPLRARRRAGELRAKGKALRIMRVWSGWFFPGPEDGRFVGRNASTHCRPCACWMCQAPRRDVPARRERAFDDLDWD